MLDQNFAGELRYAVSSQGLDAVAYAKISDFLQDLDSAIIDVAPARAWKIVSMIASRCHDSIKAGEIATERDRRGLAPLQEQPTTSCRHEVWN
jgi:hypothetical protein